LAVSSAMGIQSTTLRFYGMTAQEWSEWLSEAIRAFARTRRGSPVVEITLRDGDSFYVQHARALGELLTLAAYPEGFGQEVIDALIEDNEGDLHTPRVVIVHPTDVLRVELLAHAAGEGALPIGFDGSD
jgi:hypothetical protein